MSFRYGIWVLAIVPLLLQAGESNGPRQYGTHEHGVARLNIALDRNRLYIELISPAVNLVGFEHIPTTEQQHRAIEAAVQTLEDVDLLFALSPEADCTLVTVQVDSPLLTAADAPEDHDHDHEQDHNAMAGELHSEFSAEYRFDCSAPQRLSHLEVRLFERFPDTEEIQAQWLGPQGQWAAQLTPDDARLSF